MLNVLEEAYFDHAIAIECKHCEKDYGNDQIFGKENKFQMLFLHQGSLMTSCIMCGEGEGDQEVILSAEVDCENCQHKITVRHVRENIPCEKCNEITNKVVAIKRYRSLGNTENTVEHQL